MAATAPGYVGVLVSDPWLQNQFTQVELRSLKAQVKVFPPRPILTSGLEWLSILLPCSFFFFWCRSLAG